MVSAKQKPTTKYAVTLAVEGSKLETVAKKIRKSQISYTPGLSQSVFLFFVQ
jgi:hypothetical protein